MLSEACRKLCRKLSEALSEAVGGFLEMAESLVGSYPKKRRKRRVVSPIPL